MISSEAYNTYILANLQPECYEAGKDMYVLGRTVSNLFTSNKFGVVSFNNGVILLKKGAKTTLSEMDFHFITSFNYNYCKDYLDLFIERVLQATDKRLGGSWTSIQIKYHKIIDFCNKRGYGLSYEYVPVHYLDTDFSYEMLNRERNLIKQVADEIADTYYVRTDTEVLKGLDK